MKAQTDFDPIDPHEKWDLTFDFQQYLNGATIDSVTDWTCTLSDISQKTDADPASRLIGSPTKLDNYKVTQTVQNCIDGVTYVMEAVVLASTGEILALWANLPCSEAARKTT